MENNRNKPFRVGRRQSRCVLDAAGREVVTFPRGMEHWAVDYCAYLNQRPQPIEMPVPEVDQQAGQSGKPSRSFFHALLLPVVIVCHWMYRKATYKAFYITGTFVGKDGVLKFFSGTFCTYGNVMPIQTLSDNYQKHFEAKSVCILHFNRIPLSMVKYINTKYENGIEFHPNV